MINSIIQSIIENKDFLEKSLEELIKRKKINTKLKKYDKIIARNIKTDVEEAKTYTFEIEKTGMHSNIRKILSRIMYG